MLGKPIEKAIGERMQFQVILKNFVYPNQLRELKQQSTTNMGNFLTHLIHSEWVKNIQTSTLAFSIAQFFPLLNCQLISLILDKARFDSHISSFFSDYLVSRKIQYFWNNFSSSFFNMDMGIG